MTDQAKPRFTYEAYGSSSGLNDYSFRVTDNLNDDRVATCYLEENAKMVCGLLNKGHSLRHQELDGEELTRRFYEVREQRDSLLHALSECEACPGFDTKTPRSKTPGRGWV